MSEKVDILQEIAQLFRDFIRGIAGQCASD